MAGKVKFELAASFVLTLAGLVLAVPGAMAFLADDAALSARHNRQISPAPETSELAQAPEAYFNGVRSWFKDRVGGGLEAAELYHRTQYFVFKDAGSSQIVRNGDFVFLSAPSGGGAPFSKLMETCRSPEEWETLRHRLSDEWLSIREAIETAGYKANLLIAPSKPVLYYDRLPLSVPGDVRSACEAANQSDAPLAQLVEEDPFRIVYPIADYAALRDEPNFYPPQNFHSDGRSAYTGAEAMLRLVDPEHARELPLFRSVRRRSDIWTVFGFEREGDFSDPQFETQTVEPLQNAYGRLKAQLPDVQEGAAYWNGASPNPEKVLVLSDSFGVFFAPHLARGFRELHHLSTNGLNQEDLQTLFHEIVPSEKYDRVILLYNDGNVVGGRLSEFAGLKMNGVGEARSAEDLLIQALSGDQTQEYVYDRRFATLLGPGWWGVDDGGVWAIGGQRAWVTIPRKVPEVLGNISLRIGRLEGVAPTKGGHEVTVCGKVLEEAGSALDASSNHFWIDLSADTNGCEKEITLGIVSPLLPTPAEMGLNLDERNLGVIISGIRFGEKPAPSEAVSQTDLFVSTDSPFAKDFASGVRLSSEFERYFNDGWWLPADDGVWSRAGRTSQFRIPKEVFRNGPMNMLMVLAPKVLPAQGELEISVCGQRLNDLEAALAAEPGKPVWHPIAPIDTCTEYVDIDVKTGDFPTPLELGVNDDERKLGVQLVELRRP